MTEKRTSSSNRPPPGEVAFRELVEETDVLMLRAAPDGTILYANGAFGRALGVSPDACVGKPWWDFAAPEDRRRCEEALRGWVDGRVGETTFEHGLLDQSGERRYVWWTVRVHAGDGAHVNAIGRDVTEARRVEEERLKLDAGIQQAQKLESLGLLAGAIIHDFNNILTGLMGNAELALLGLSKVSPVRIQVERIKKDTLRASRLITQLSAYAARDAAVKKPLSLNRLIQEMAPLIETSHPKKTGVHLDLAENPPAINADATQVRQLIMSLLTNAFEAIGEEGGRVTVATRVMTADRPYLETTKLGVLLSVGEYVCLAVSDTGRGMHDKTRERVFDPFFSTKATGRGLGMTAALGIVRRHAGTIRVTPREGEGTCVEVLFPPCASAAAEAVASDEAVDASKWRHEGTALVIDDEQTVQDVVAEMLARCGMKALSAMNGRDGVSVFQAYAQGIDVVLMDVAMPVMDGYEAANEIRLVRDDVPILFCSGKTERDVRDRLPPGIAGVIEKPFRFEKLVAELRRVLS